MTTTTPTHTPPTTRIPSPIPAGSFQRALAEDRERTRTQTQVDYADLNDGHRTTGSLPYVVVTPALRARRGWEPREASEEAYREAQAQKKAARADRSAGRGAIDGAKR